MFKANCWVLVVPQDGYDGFIGVFSDLKSLKEFCEKAYAIPLDGWRQDYSDSEHTYWSARDPMFKNHYAAKPREFNRVGM